MRVLTVGNRAPEPSAGGYEVVWADLAAALEARGHEVAVLHPPALRSFWEDGTWLKPGWREARRIERHNARTVRDALDGQDLVIWMNMGGLSMSVLRQDRVPALGVVHDGWMLYGPQKDRWPRRFAPSSRALWTFNSEATRAATLEAVALQRTEVVAPGVDPAAFSPADPGPWAWQLAVVGRVSPEKGVDVAVRALDLLPSEATLTVTGPGEPPATHPRATFTGAVARERLREAYAQADCLLFPVTWPEPFGLVPLEAMAVGRPVVATGTGGSSEYLRHEENCLIVPPGDAAELAGAVRRLAADEELRARLVAGGRATAARNTQRAFLERMCALAEGEAG